MTGITNLSAAIESLREIVGLMTPGEWLQPDGAEGDLWNNDAEPGERQTPDRVLFGFSLFVLVFEKIC